LLDAGGHVPVVRSPIGFLPGVLPAIATVPWVIQGPLLEVCLVSLYEHLSAFCLECSLYWCREAQVAYLCAVSPFPVTNDLERGICIGILSERTL
jgi:hypothetical protein